MHVDRSVVGVYIARPEIASLVERVLHSILSRNDFSRWRWFRVGARETPNGIWYETVIVGARKADEGTDELLHAKIYLDPSHIYQERYLEETLSKVVQHFLSYTDCECRLKEIKWHRDEDGDRTVPEFVQHYCDVHRPDKNVEDSTVGGEL